MIWSSLPLDNFSLQVILWQSVSIIDIDDNNALNADVTFKMNTEAKKSVYNITVWAIRV